jgi:hypothetical protein
VGITDFMRLNPYSGKNNPAYFLPYNGYFGIPAISNMNFSFFNSGLQINKFIVRDNHGKVIRFTPNKFVNSLSKNNWFNSDVNFEILGLGFRIGKSFFSLSYQFKMEERFRYSKDLFRFIFQGNLAQDGNGKYLYTEATPAILEISPNLNIYQEIGIGFQRQILDKLYIGVRPKILFGLINFHTDSFQAKIWTNPDDFTIYGNYNVAMKAASVFPFYKIENSEIILGTEYSDYRNLAKHIFSKNLGFAIDLGTVYRINQQIRVSASVTDLGFISWKGTPLQMGVNSMDVEWKEFSGFQSEQIMNFIRNGFDFNFDSLINTVNNNFYLEPAINYSTSLTSKIMLDCYFDLTPSNRFIIQGKGYILGKNFLPQLTLAYNGTFFNIFDVVVSYSMLKKSFANLGVGLGVRLGPLHLYTGTDNVFAAVNLLNARKINATFGLLFDFPVIKRIKEPELNSLFQSQTEKSEKAKKQTPEKQEKKPKQKTSESIETTV